MVAIIFLTIMLIDLLYYKEANGVSVRGGVYIAAIFSIYLMEHSQRASELPVVDILFFFHIGYFYCGCCQIRGR